MKWDCIVAAEVAILLGSAFTAANAQSTSSAASSLGNQSDVASHEDEVDGWQLKAIPYLWGAGIDGTVTANGMSADFDAGFFDILENIDFAFMGRIEATKGKWLLFGDGMYMEGSDSQNVNRTLGSSVDLSAIIGGIDLNLPTPPPPGVLPPEIQDIVDGLLQGAVDNVEDAIITAIQGADPLPVLKKVEVDMSMAVGEFGLGYQLHRWDIEDLGHVSFDVLGGGRYYSVEIEETLTIEPGLLEILPEKVDLRAQHDWIDLTIGGQVDWQINERWALGVRGDVGGFGIGSSSELAWNLVGAVQYNLNHSVSLIAGYRVLDIDYARGSGEDRFEFDAMMRGPVLGASIRF